MHHFQRVRVTTGEVDTCHSPVEYLTEKFRDACPSLVVNVSIGNKSYFESGIVYTHRVIHVLPVAKASHLSNRVMDFAGYAHVKTPGIETSDMFFISSRAARADKRSHGIIDRF